MVFSQTLWKQHHLFWRLHAVTSHHRMNSSHPVAAVCQLTSTPDKEANLSTCERLILQAKQGGASMIFLPEGFDYLGSSREETLQLSESLQGDIISRYSQLARKLKVWLSLGGFHERGHNWENDRRIYNSHVIINGQVNVKEHCVRSWCDFSTSEIVSVYRKGHLFDVELTGKGVSLKESAFTVPGPSLVPPVQTPVGKVGLGICYDLRFPEMSSALQRSVLLRARAIETQCYVLAAAQVGAHHEKRSSYGHTIAVDPWGVVMADCGGTDVGVAMVEIDMDRLKDTRKDMPVRKHRREKEFYCSLD
ncbi:deaminated glutathione amidase [Tachysurus ichikawai]